MTIISDLEEQQWSHEVELAYSDSIPAEFPAILVGWLGTSVPATGRINSDTLRKLEWAADNRNIDQGWLGEHECEICNSHYDRGEILICDEEKNYVAPHMILHYIKDHSYLPPQEFLDAVAAIEIKSDEETL